MINPNFTLLLAQNILYATSFKSNFKVKYLAITFAPLTANGSSGLEFID